METISYEYEGALYVNLTNRCDCACVFCLRQNGHKGSIYADDLWLDHEPTREEALRDLLGRDLAGYREPVLCGFGEPTERLDVLLETAAFIKERYGKPIRIDTNGLADLICKEPTAHRLKGLIDTVSISLNTPDKERYLELTRSRFGIGSFDAMLAYAAECKKYVPNVVMTTVDTTITKEEEEQCRAICERLGVTYRIRPWED